MAGWIGVDLDGTLAIYTGWISPDTIGEPIAPMVQRVKDWLALGQEVRIFTARVCSLQPEGHAYLARSAIETWCEKHIGQRLKVTAEKDWNMIELYDDRCIPIEFNMGTVKENV